MTVENNPDKGVTFSDSASRAAGGRGMNRVTILVADDDESLRRVTQMELEEARLRRRHGGGWARRSALAGAVAAGAGHLRSEDARALRPGPAEDRCARSHPDDHGHPDHRLRHRTDRRRSHEGRRVRLHHQADRLRATGAGGATRHGAPATCSKKSATCAPRWTRSTASTTSWATPRRCCACSAWRRARRSRTPPC